MVGDSDAISSWLGDFVNTKRGREKLEGLGHHLAAWVASRAWSEKILRDTEVQEALPRLFHADSQIRRQQSLSLDPLQLTYAYRMKSVDLEALDALIPPFLVVAGKLKQAQEPTEKLSLSSTENYLLKHPYRVAFLILFGLMFLLLVPFILIGLFMLVSR